MNNEHCGKCGVSYDSDYQGCGCSVNPYAPPADIDDIPKREPPDGFTPQEALQLAVACTVMMIISSGVFWAVFHAVCYVVIWLFE